MAQPPFLSPLIEGEKKEKAKKTTTKNTRMFIADKKAAPLYSTQENLRTVIHLSLEHKNFASFAH